MSNEALNTVLSHLVIPVVVIHDAATTPAVTDGLVVGGLPVAEVTFRTDAAQPPSSPWPVTAGSPSAPEPSSMPAKSMRR